MKRFKWTDRQLVTIRKIAAMSEHPTLDLIRTFYPYIRSAKAEKMLEMVKTIRKEFSISSDIKPTGIRNSNGAGWIYLIVNKRFSGWIKCGMTSNLEDRLRVYNSYDPYNEFKILSSKEVDDRRLSEKLLIRKLSLNTEVANNEWFKISESDALKVFEEI